MPIFGSITNPYLNILQEMRTVRNLGFNFIEVTTEEPATTPQVLLANKKEINNLSKKYNLPLEVIHAPIATMLDTNFEEIREGWVNLSKEIIRVSKELGIQKINFHACRDRLFIKKYGKQILNTSIKSLNELIPTAEKYKMKIVLETPSRIENLNYIIKKVPEVGVNLDVAHIFLVGGIDYVRKFIQVFENKIEHIHMHDNHGEEDEHLPIGEGIIDYRKVVEWLKEIGYDNTITFEVFTIGEIRRGGRNTEDKIQAKISMEKIKRMWNE